MVMVRRLRARTVCTACALLLLPLRACEGMHNERPTATGAWVVPKGFRNYHLDVQLTSAIATLLGRGARHNLTLLDLGAGKGLYVRALRAVGILNVTGYEGVAGIEAMTSHAIRQREFTAPFDPCLRFDVVICLEVAEHIPKELERTFLQNVNCSAGDGLIMSWAPPGQGGTGHVNLRTQGDFLARLDALGFIPDHTASRFLSEQAALRWFRKNIIAFRRRDRPSPFRVTTPTLALKPRASSPEGESKVAALGESGALRALDRMRGGFAKLEARLDELSLANTDALLREALTDYRKGLQALADVANPAKYSPERSAVESAALPMVSRTDGHESARGEALAASGARI